ncbi:MAG TPA: metal ABC transporter permease [Candidatus Kapabacteria bacterium]|nr:metal ABC transporter permease [Candidatus Kapabacteria bacterium]
MIEMFAQEFFIKALIVGILIGFSSSYFSAFVVQRKLSFIGSGLSHAAFGGVALGLLLNIEPLYIAMPFTLIVSILIFYLDNKTKLSTDTIIGVVFSFAVAMGIIFLALKESYSQDAYAYLFGSILTVNTMDIIISGVLFILTLLSFFLFWERWAYSTFDSELARAELLPVDKDNYIFAGILGLIIALAIKIVGIILISAFLVIPGATAKLISKTFFKLTINSIIIGISTIVAGLVLSYEMDLPSGALIIIIQSFLFLFVTILSKFK